MKPDIYQRFKDPMTEISGIPQFSQQLAFFGQKG